MRTKSPDLGARLVRGALAQSLFQMAEPRRTVYYRNPILFFIKFELFEFPDGAMHKPMHNSQVRSHGPASGDAVDGAVRRPVRTVLQRVQGLAQPREPGVPGSGPRRQFKRRSADYLCGFGVKRTGPRWCKATMQPSCGRTARPRNAAAPPSAAPAAARAGTCTRAAPWALSLWALYSGQSHR